MAMTRTRPRNGARRLSQMRVTWGAGESEVMSVAISVALIVFRKGRRAMTEYTANRESGNAKLTARTGARRDGAFWFSLIVTRASCAWIHGRGRPCHRSIKKLLINASFV